MQKSFLLLPLAAIILSACSSNPPAPIVNAQGSEMTQNSQVGGYQGSTRPVEATNNSGWQTEAPAALPTPSYSQPTYTPPQPSYQPAYQPPPQPVVTKPVAVAPKPTPKPVVKPKKSVPQDFTIPRDEKNAPIYSQIDKGFYNGDTYTVRKGDTMFLIAYIAGKDVKEIAKLNNMSEPYQLNVGQQIKLGKEDVPKEQPQQLATTPVPTRTPQPIKPVEPEVTYTQAANGTAYGSDGTVTGPIKAKTGAEAPITPRPVITATTGTAPTVGRITATAGTSQSVQSTSYNQAPALSSVKWQWPTQGRVIAGFSSAEGGNKGLDITGNKGQPVKAAAAGKVVYAGNSLQGYGNLIIIKHNDDFLSAYAHNDSMKVDEQDTVKAGETIATLGSTGTNSNKLHFEIRYQGKSVDPARYLPRR